jgi:acetyltransferase-like isoleucine patch superfamily enzyme
MNQLSKYKILIDNTLLRPWNEFFTSLYWYMKFPNSKIAFSEKPSKSLHVQVGDDTHCVRLVLMLVQREGIENYVKIGSGCHISEGTIMILSNDHVKGKPSQPADTKGGRIEIGDDVWVGVRVTIMRNLKIGKGATIGAGSVVTHDVAPYDVVAGVPARSIKKKRGK